MNYWPLLGVLVVLLGFLLRFNPILVVISAGITSAFAAKFPPLLILEALGDGFLKTRTLPVILLLPLSVIGLSERYGLKQQAQLFISKVKGATVGRMLVVYLFVRETSAALGLTSLGGHAQMVRPLVAPMAEALAQQQMAAERALENQNIGSDKEAIPANGLDQAQVSPEQAVPAFNQTTDPLTQLHSEKVKAMAAATDNIGLFFGEDIFVAFGAIILMHTFLRELNIETDPLHIALWGIPTAIAAFIIHATRLLRFDSYLRAERSKLSKSL